MPLPAAFPAAILETILTRLAPLFLAGAAGDITAARQAAAQMLGSYHPQNENELRLAANIVAFSFQALEALSQATAPDLPQARVLRLRGSAVSLHREAARAERRLDQLRKGTIAQPGKAPPEALPPQPRIENAIKLIQDTNTVASSAKANKLTWSQAYEQRQRETRIAASLKRAEARVAAQANVATPDPIAIRQV